ncbi:DUF3244 domain-containing protein [Bacteroides sp. 519]|uniref:DUF3244 domain-containing protein n=1 Tax=Bacteroides sp. 519 TaxID=2302937 RepID=UPI0013CFF4CB|nr:DUF3244 domain-containing protein [Bacteroides sp. 519]NDV57193.1 DUF3244 domain-containing protein [Bacteroides sp. 519]
MKNFVTKFVVLVFALFVSLHIHAAHENEVPLHGDWTEEGGLRSLKPGKPQVLLGDYLEVYCKEPIADNIVITIVDATGNEVYQNSVSSPYPNYSLVIPTTGCSGEYTITIKSRKYGTLTGIFIIE